MIGHLSQHISEFIAKLLESCIGVNYSVFNLLEHALEGNPKPIRGSRGSFSN